MPETVSDCADIDRPWIAPPRCSVSAAARVNVVPFQTYTWSSRLGFAETFALVANATFVPVASFATRRAAAGVKMKPPPLISTFAPLVLVSCVMLPTSLHEVFSCTLSTNSVESTLRSFESATEKRSVTVLLPATMFGSWMQVR